MKRWECHWEKKGGWGIIMFTKMPKGLLVTCCKCDCLNQEKVQVCLGHWFLQISKYLQESDALKTRFLVTEWITLHSDAVIPSVSGERPLAHSGGAFLAVCTHNRQESRLAGRCVGVLIWNLGIFCHGCQGLFLPLWTQTSSPFCWSSLRLIAFILVLGRLDFATPSW